MSGLTDRELLELAAKAADMPMCEEWDCTADGILIGRGDGDLTNWNPLADDGDALRLAVKLHLNIINSPFGVDAGLPESSITFEGWGDNRESATRRAIVRAAAAIGEAMP